MVELSDGDILAAWYAGSGEAKADVAVVSSRWDRESGSWGPVEVISDTPGKPEGNCVLFRSPDGEIWLIYALMHGKLEGPWGPGVRWVTCDIRMRTSDDDGESWSEPRIIWSELGFVPKCKPITLDNGDIILGFEEELGFSKFLITPDRGERWIMTGPAWGVPNQHPTIIQRDNGDILALFRPSLFSRIGRSLSHDRGRSWELVTNTELPNPGAAIDMVKAGDGRVFLVYNDSFSDRNPLTLAMSEDEGESWAHKRDIGTGEGRFGYPAIIEDSDGLLHVTYTHSRLHIAHLVIEPDWICG